MPPQRSLRKNPRPGEVITSMHTVIAGEPYAVDNSKDSLLYPGETYSDFLSEYYPDDLIWYFYDNYNESPSDQGYIPYLGGMSLRDFNQIVASGEDPGVQKETFPVYLKKNNRFNHGIVHDVIGVEYLGKIYKVKMSGRNEYQNSIYKNGIEKFRPYFYLEIYNPELKQLEKCYGEFLKKPEGYSFGRKTSSFGKRSDIKYLRSLI